MPTAYPPATAGGTDRIQVRVKMTNALRILVAGGLGTVGAGLIAELRKRGHHVVSCDLHHQADEIGFSLRTDVEVPLYARCDVGDFRQLERVFERCGPFDYVYHCAAERSEEHTSELQSP